MFSLTPAATRSSAAPVPCANFSPNRAYLRLPSPPAVSAKPSPSPPTRPPKAASATAASSSWSTATPSATPPRLPPLPVLTNNVLHGPSSSIPEGHNTACPSSSFPFCSCGPPLRPNRQPGLFSSVPSVVSVLNPSFLVFLLSVNSAFSVCSVLSLFFWSRHSSLATRLPRPGRGHFLSS